MVGRCCSDGGASDKIKTELLEQNEDREESIMRLLEVMRSDRIFYRTKGAPLNTDPD